jgi:capsular exopolysaccharide synthesis family protein
MELLEPATTDLSSYLQKLKRHWLPATAVFVLSIAFASAAALGQKNSYEAEGKLLFRAERSPFLSGLGQDDAALRAFVQTQNPIASQVEVVTSSSLLQKVISALQLRDQEGKQLEVESLRSRLKVKIIGGTDVLSVTYTSRSPQEAALVINTLMKLYVKNDAENARNEARTARQFIAKQLPRTELKVKETEIALRDFRQRYRIADLVEKARVSEEEATRLDGQIADAKSELDGALARSTALQGQVGLNPQSAIALGTLSESTAVQGALQELQVLERQLASLQSDFQDLHPGVTRIRNRRAALTSLLQEQVSQTLGSQASLPSRLLQAGALKQALIKDFLVSEVQRLTASRRLTSLLRSRQVYQQQLSSLPSLTQRQGELERKLQAAQTTYETMLKKVQELQVAESQNASNARIIESALVPRKPVFSKAKAVLLGLGVLGGAFLATVTVPLLEMRQRSRVKLRIIQDDFEYPLLGSVPCLSPTITSEGDQQSALVSLIRGIYRAVQYNLKFLNLNGHLKAVVVSSCIEHEGKSTIAAHLAVTMARLGRSVLLIDANIHKPTLDKVFGIQTTTGLTDVLLDNALRLTEIQMSMAHLLENHLHVLSAGEISEHVDSHMFTGKRLATVLNYFSKTYDFVVIDTPSLTQSPEALHLGQLVDGLLLVVNPALVDQKSFNIIQKTLKDSDQRVIGVVVNDVTSQSSESMSYPPQATAFLTESREKYILMRDQ